jgi:hypothetical protein
MCSASLLPSLCVLLTIASFFLLSSGHFHSLALTSSLSSTLFHSIPLSSPLSSTLFYFLLLFTRLLPLPSGHFHSLALTSSLSSPSNLRDVFQSIAERFPRVGHSWAHQSFKTRVSMLRRADRVIAETSISEIAKMSDDELHATCLLRGIHINPNTGVTPRAAGTVTNAAW